MDLTEFAAWEAGAQVESVAVLGDDVGHLALLVQHEERHVGGGGLSQAEVAGRHLLTLQSGTVE